MNLQTSYYLYKYQTEPTPSWVQAEKYDNCEQKGSLFYRLFHKQ